MIVRNKYVTVELKILPDLFGSHYVLNIIIHGYGRKLIYGSALWSKREWKRLVRQLHSELCYLPKQKRNAICGALGSAVSLYHFKMYGVRKVVVS